MTSKYHLAQLNIGRVLWPPDDPRMAGFMGRLDELNKLADESPGFVWRLQTEAGKFHELSQDLVQLSDATHSAPGAVGLSFMALMRDFHDLGSEAAQLGVGANALLHDLQGLAHADPAPLAGGGHH